MARLSICSPVVRPARTFNLVDVPELNYFGIGVVGATDEGVGCIYRTYYYRMHSHDVVEVKVTLLPNSYSNTI